MSDFEVKVIGEKKRKKKVGPPRGVVQRAGAVVRGVLMRPRMLALAGAAGVVLVVGTPHVGWEYECSHPMRGPGSCRYVSWCAYYGVQGRRIVMPENNQQCSVVTMLPLN